MSEVRYPETAFNLMKNKKENTKIKHLKDRLTIPLILSEESLTMRFKESKEIPITNLEKEDAFVVDWQD